MNYFQKIQTLGNKIATNLQTMGVSASFNDGGLTLADKILRIQHFHDGLRLYANKYTAQTGDTVNLYALLLNDRKPVSNEIVLFSGIGGVRTETYYGDTYTVYTVFGEGEMICSPGKFTFMQGEPTMGIGESINSSIFKIIGSTLFIDDYPSSAYGFDYDPTQPLEIWITSTITSNTFDFVETATTGTNGIATKSYTCTSTGTKEIYVTSDTLQSLPIEIEIS